MKRREFLAATVAVSLVPAMAPTMASARMAVNYTPGLVDKMLAEGKTVFVDFGTDWCSTCAAQERVIDALRKDNPEYDANIVFVYVNWDEYSRDKLSKRLKIPRRSVLVALKGDAEIGRVVLGTSKKEIKALMDASLKAAMA